MLLRALLGAVIVATATSFALNAPHVALAPRLATPPRTLPRQACSTRRSGLLMTTGKNLERGKEMAVKLNKEGTEQRLNMLEAQVRSCSTHPADSCGLKGALGRS